MGVLELAVLLLPYCSKLGEESDWSGQVEGLCSREIGELEGLVVGVRGPESGCGPGVKG